ncbi:MAG: molybdopterin converting factor subunit 1 [Terriglobia bacterium]
MSVEVLFFARIREIVGESRITVHEGEIRTVADIWAQVCNRFPQARELEKVLLFAVNQEFANMQTRVKAGDEIAIFPPVSGGEKKLEDPISGTAPEDFFQIVRTALHIDDLVDQLRCPEDGAIVIFDGIVRNNSLGRKTLYLEYDGYELMALKKMKEIGSEIRGKWPINRLGMMHRLGRLEIGEASVIIVVTAAHRKTAFEACQYAIDTLKRVVPIWKKEFFEDGEVWIEGEGYPLPRPSEESQQ